MSDVMSHSNVTPEFGEAGGYPSHPDLQDRRAAGFETRIDPSASLGADIAFGPRCRIEAGAVIGDGARLGRECVVDAGAAVDAGEQLGDHMRRTADGQTLPAAQLISAWDERFQEWTPWDTLGAEDIGTPVQVWDTDGTVWQGVRGPSGPEPSNDA